jgi:hypothetical protein
MNARILLLGALLIGSAFGASSFSAPAAAQSTQCWAGYHVDRRGDCQPDVPTVDQRCGPGLQAQVWPNGQSYICVPIGQQGY